jgi:hypothetical protein
MNHLSIVLTYSTEICHCDVNDDSKGFLESCFLCGVIMGHDVSKRRKRVSFFEKMLRLYWKESPHVWHQMKKACESTAEQDTIALCMPCMHWTSRCVKNQRIGYGHEKEQVPMDKFISYVMNPALAGAPDERIMIRFMHALRTIYDIRGTRYVNPYAHMFPEWAIKILVETKISTRNYSDTANETKKLILIEWWKSNGNPVVLPNRDIAGQIRRELQSEIEKIHLEMEQGL